jgi:predicted hotdog family 3-hydroxylacyl-ACP dehydratase
MNSGNTTVNDQLRTIDVLTLLPQRPPFVMIDHLVHFDKVRTVTETTVRADNLFCEGQQLNPCALMEIIAQTCAARMGYINQYIYRESVKLGFIGAVRNLLVLRTPCVGETLTTTIDVVEEVMQLTLVTATVGVGSETIATAEMKIALSDTEAVDTQKDTAQRPQTVG